MRILLVENDVRLAYLIRRTLTAEGHAVTAVDDGRMALRAAAQPGIDLIILDRLLPDVDGLDICRQLRARGSGLPILMLIDDPMAGTERPNPQSAADEYLLKPFALRELLLRIVELLRRRGFSVSQPSCVELGDLCLDLAQQQAHRGRRIVDLTDEECAILHYLMRHPGRIHTRTEITDHVWGYDLSASAPAVDEHIRFLRRKIDGGSSRHLIRQVFEAGYTIDG